MQTIDIVFAQHEPILRAKAARFRIPAAEVEDVVQQTFMKLCVEVEAGSEICNVGAWLGRVMFFGLVDSWRHYQRNESHGVAYFADAIGDDLNPLDAIATGETFDAVRDHVENLPEDDRLLITMRYFDGRDMASVAEELGISYFAACSRSRRIRETLATQMKGAEA